MEISEEAREKREAYAADGRTAWPTGIVRDAALVLWETSRRDEGTISAAGANIAAQALASAGLLRDEPCTCKPPPITEGPEEDCPRHGRPYSYWVEGVSELGARVGDLTRERDRWREKAQESGKAYADANTKHHQEWDRADRLERLADTLAEKAVDLEDRARAAEAERDDLLAMKARVGALADEWEKTYEWSQGLTVPSRRSLPRTVVDIRAAIRGES